MNTWNLSPIVLLLTFVQLSFTIQHYPNILARKRVRNETQVTLKTCGVAKAVFKDGDRIVGGRNALDGEFPWQVSLRFKSFFIEPTHLCGAAILNDRWIITAAHCVEGRSIKNFEVAVGEYKLMEKSDHVAVYEVAEMIPHKGFNRDTFQDDIALIRLKKPITFARTNGFVNGICLASRNQTVQGFATATGWGTTVEDGDAADILQAVDLPIVPHYICEAIYGDGVITSTMICAGEPQGGTDSCQGDSGGPLIQTDKNGRNVLIGIVSWGIGCARPGLPGIYTSVPSYIDWILTNIK